MMIILTKTLMIRIKLTSDGKRFIIILRIMASLLLSLLVICTMVWNFIEYMSPNYIVQHPMLMNVYFIVSPAIYSFLLFKIWLKKNISSSIYALILLIVYLLFIDKPYRDKIDREYLRNNVKITGVVVRKYGDRGTRQIVVKYFDGSVYIDGFFQVPQKRYSFNDFCVGDTVIVKYSVKRPDISTIYIFKPTKSEIQEFRTGKKGRDE